MENITPYVEDMDSLNTRSTPDHVPNAITRALGTKSRGSFGLPMMCTAVAIVTKKVGEFDKD